MKNPLILALSVSLSSLAFGDSIENQTKMGDLVKQVSQTLHSPQSHQVEKEDEVLVGYKNVAARISDGKRIDKNHYSSQKNLNIVKPPKNSKNNSLELKSGTLSAYEKGLDYQINGLFTLAKKFKNDGRRGGIWLRLAELYIEKANLVNDHQQDVYDQNLKARRSISATPY